MSQFAQGDIDRIIEMAWEDRTPFEAIRIQFGLSESDVIALMRQSLKPGSFKRWRERVSGRKTKHLQLRGFAVGRGYCATQYKAAQYRQGKLRRG